MFAVGAVLKRRRSRCGICMARTGGAGDWRMVVYLSECERLNTHRLVYLACMKWDCDRWQRGCQCCCCVSWTGGFALPRRGDVLAAGRASRIRICRDATPSNHRRAPRAVGQFIRAYVIRAETLPTRFSCVPTLAQWRTAILSHMLAMLSVCPAVESFFFSLAPRRPT